MLLYIAICVDIYRKARSECKPNPHGVSRRPESESAPVQPEEMLKGADAAISAFERGVCMAHECGFRGLEISMCYVAADMAQEVLANMATLDGAPR
jgi:hypothetical protein